jgi:hypothetical protein
MARSQENLKMIRFEGELLPNWARLLDLASGLCAVPEVTGRWFTALTSSNGVADGRTVVEHCELLRGELQRRREEVLSELRRDKQDVRPMQVYEAWMYALETMIQEAKTRKTCAWVVEGAEDSGGESGDGGEITLRRV